MLYKSVGFFLRRTLDALNLRRHHKRHNHRHTTKVFYKVEVVETTQELGLANKTVLISLIVELNLGYLVDSDVALCDAFVAILPEVLTSVAKVDGVASKLCSRTIVAWILGCVAHPAVVGSHVAHIVELVYLPPVATIEEVVATSDLLCALLFCREVVLHVLLTTYWLLKEVGARSHTQRKGRHKREANDISFHNLNS